MKKLKDYSLVILLLIVWEILFDLHVISEFLLPSPYQVILAFIGDFGLLMRHTYYTLLVAFIGVFIGIILSFILSLSMDLYQGLYDLVYPVIILTQTIPTLSLIHI